MEELLRELARGLGGGIPGAIRGGLAFLVVIIAAWVAWMLVAGAARQAAQSRGRPGAEALAGVLFLRPVIVILGLACALQASGLLDLGLSGLGPALFRLVSAVVWAAALGAAAIVVAVALSARTSPALASLLAGLHLRSRRAKADALPQVGDVIEGDGFGGRISAFTRYHAVLVDEQGNKDLVPLVRLLDGQYRVRVGGASPADTPAPPPEPAVAPLGTPSVGFGPPPPPGRLIM